MEDRGFLECLLDFSFSSFLTTKVIAALYGLGILVITILSLIFAFSGFPTGVLAGIGTFALSPFVFAVGIVFWRVLLELIVVFFRIAENIELLVKHGGNRPS